MKAFNSVRLSSIRWTFVLILLILPQLARAQWQASLGAQNKSMGRQALAFLPNEIWIHMGDSITWTSNVDEIHTVSFLTAGQMIPNSFPQNEENTKFSYAFFSTARDGNQVSGRFTEGPSLDGKGQFSVIKAEPLGEEPTR